MILTWNNAHCFNSERLRRSYNSKQWIFSWHSDYISIQGAIYLWWRLYSERIENKTVSVNWELEWKRKFLWRYEAICREFSGLYVTALEICFEIVSVIVGVIFTIVAVNCGGLSSPMNGSIFGNLTVYPNIVTFGCDLGFILRGSSVRKCQSNGTWDGYKTVCEGTIF